jgi:dienelactone hydrolase
MAWEDRRALDYLASRPEVDAGRLGCAGLSGGGLRTIYLSGLDPRIRCAVCVGFMSTIGEMLDDKVRMHTWMFHVPHLSALLDLPDIASLHGPQPLMLQCDRDDPLWTLAGQQQADAKLKKIYAAMGAADSYQGMFYPGPHKFDLPMQKDAFEWFDRWLE